MNRTSRLNRNSDHSNKYGAINLDSLKEVITLKPNNKKQLTTVCLLFLFIAIIVASILVAYKNYYTSNNIYTTPSKPSTPLCVKSCVGTLWDNKLLIFGGRTKIHAKDIKFLNDVMYFSYSEKNGKRNQIKSYWEWQVSFSGNAPYSPYESNQTMSHVPVGVWKASGVLNSDTMELFIYGGSANKFTFSDQNSLWKYSLSHHNWTMVNITNPNGKPSVRGQCMAMYNNELIVMFGGKYMDIKGTGKDANLLLGFNISVPHLGWYPLLPILNETNATKTEVIVQPPARQALTCEMVKIKGGWKFVVFGGRQKVKVDKHVHIYKYLNDLWTLNMNNFIWTEIKNKSNVVPQPVAHHSSAVVKDSTFIVVGGHNETSLLSQNYQFDFAALDVNGDLLMQWKQLASLPKRMERCEQVSVGIEIPTQNTHQVLMFGGQLTLPIGRGKTDILSNDVLGYDCSENKWTVLSNNTCHQGRKYWGYP